MRAQARQSAREEEEESAFISMTDMTVGFLFIVMILLAFFASQFRQDNLETVPKARFDAEVLARREAEQERDVLAARLQQVTSELAAQMRVNVEQAETIARLEAEIVILRRRIAELESSLRDPLEDYLRQVADARRRLLEQLRDSLRIDFPDLNVILSEQSDALQFQGEGLFREGRAEFVSAQKRDIVRQIARRLDEVLPCYTFFEVPRPEIACDNPNLAIIEAVQIEGHTDSNGPYAFNTGLSANRATTTFGLMMETVPGLRGFRNTRDQAVMSFAGYGPDRPIARNDTPEGRATNRRIDLRFIMVTPASTDEIAEIRRKFLGLAR